MRSDKEIFHIIENSFLPLRGGVEVSGYGEKMRIGVLDSDSNVVLSMNGLTSSRLREGRFLSENIEYMRIKLTKMGYALEPWKFIG